MGEKEGFQCEWEVFSKLRLVPERRLCIIGSACSHVVSNDGVLLLAVAIDHILHKQHTTLALSAIWEATDDKS